MASYSYDVEGSRYRWRNVIPDPESGAQAGSWTITHSTADQHRWLGSIAEALTGVGYFRRPVIHAWEAGDFGEVVSRWAEVTSAARKWGPSSLRHMITYINGLLVDLRDVLGLPPDSKIPTSRLSRAAGEELGIRWSKSDVPHAAYRRSVVLRESWDWAIKQDIAGVPNKNFAPEVAVPTYGIAEAPTIAQCDQMIRQIRCPHAYLAAILESRTGLRIAQVCELRVQDVDVQSWTLRIVPGNGKSKQEKQGRTIPLASCLRDIPELIEALKRLPDAHVVAKTANAVRAGILEAWRMSDVPERFWNPPEHTKGRSSHALRAAWSQHLSDEGISDTITEFLMGHVGGSTLRSAYAVRAAREDVLRRAVNLIPPVPKLAPTRTVLVSGKRGRGRPRVDRRVC